MLYLTIHSFLKCTIYIITGGKRSIQIPELYENNAITPMLILNRKIGLQILPKTKEILF